MKQQKIQRNNSYTSFNSPKSSQATKRQVALQQKEQNQQQQSKMETQSSESLQEQFKNLKEKYKQCKQQLSETQARLNASSRESGRLKEQNQSLQQQLEKMSNVLEAMQQEKWQEKDEIANLKHQLTKQSDRNKVPGEDISRLRTNLEQIEQIVKQRTVVFRKLLAKNADIVVNVQKILKKTSNFQGKSSLQQSIKDIQQNLTKLAQINSKDESCFQINESYQSAQQYNEGYYQDDEIQKIKEERNNLQELLVKSKQEQDQLVTSYRMELDKMRDYITNMRERIVTLETSHNQQEEQNLLKIKLLEQEKQDCFQANISLQATVQEQGDLIIHLKEYIHTLGDQLSIKQQQQKQGNKRLENEQAKQKFQTGKRFYIDKEVPLGQENEIESEIYVLDQEIQMLQRNLQEALNDSSQF